MNFRRFSKANGGRPARGEAFHCRDIGPDMAYCRGTGPDTAAEGRSYACPDREARRSPTAFQDLGFGFRDSGLGFRALGFESRVSDFRFRVSNLDGGREEGRNLRSQSGAYVPTAPGPVPLRYQALCCCDRKSLVTRVWGFRVSQLDGRREEGRDLCSRIRAGDLTSGRP